MDRSGYGAEAHHTTVRRPLRDAPRFRHFVCHNIQLNNVPLFSPCFMICNTKEFYYNLKVLQTDEVQKIVCLESYSTIEQRVTRDKLVLIQGYKAWI